jgi:hypothetical protein
MAPRADIGTVPRAMTEHYDGPEYNLWLHLESGLDAAMMELDALTDESRASLEWLAQAIVLGRDQLAIRPKSVEAKLLLVDDVLLADKWVRFAVELIIARRGVARSEKALRRFIRINPLSTLRALPLRAEGYVREAMETFAFGFDAACIALVCASFEQLMKDELVRQGRFTEPQLRRERLTAEGLLAKARQASIVSTSSSAAERLVKKRNNVMHEHLYDDKVSEQQALDSLTELLSVIREVLGGGSSEI